MSTEVGSILFHGSYMLVIWPRKRWAGQYPWKKLGYLPWEKLLWLWPKTFLPRSLRKWRKNSVECESHFGRSQIFLSKCLDLQHHSSKRWGFNNIYISSSVPLISSILCSRSWNICDSYSLLMRAMSFSWYFKLSEVQGEATRLFLTYCEEITNSKAHPVLFSEVLAQIRPPSCPGNESHTVFPPAGWPKPLIEQG